MGIGIIAVVYSFFKKNKVGELKITGEKVEGIVFEGETSSNWSMASSSTSNTVTVRFVTKKKEWITADIQLDTNFSSKQYKAGDKLEIYYDPNDPYNFCVEEEKLPKSKRLFVALSGIALIAVGVYLLVSNSDS